MGQSGVALRKAKDDDGNDDVKKQVDSDDNNQKPIYQLVNVKDGGGKLIDILKSSARISSSSFTVNESSSDLPASFNAKHPDNAIDMQIHNLVEPLLYNKGEGKLVPLRKIWQARFNQLDEKEEDDLNNGFVGSDCLDCREVCWKLEERGAVGETALHICFLLSTPTHMILAKKLLSMFPKLINDIYTCDRYFGESSLHMAIVNENVRIVKLLLDFGADVHERCLGSFFLPNDQIDTANSAIKNEIEKITAVDLNENHLLNTLDTNYDGYAYWGEYPLSFAICLGLADCYKLLLAKRANPNKQDSNGNSSLHMAVIANRIDMFDLCYSNGANLSILNRQNLSPLTLAAKLKKVEMFFHILTIQRQVNWIFCNVGFVKVALTSIDSVNITDGSSDDDSVLSIVVFGGSNDHLQMLDGLVSRLLEVKWETSIKGKFYWWLLKFLLFLAISSIAYITRFNQQQHLSKNQDYNYLNKTINKYSEYILICFVLHYLWIIQQRILPSFGLRQIMKSLAQAPEMFLFTLTCLLILFCFPLRLLKLQQAEDFLAAIIMFTLPLKLLFFCRASRSVGSFVVMIYKIVVDDVLCFVVFLIIFVAGFSQSFLIIFRSHNSSSEDKNYFVNLFDGIISMHMMAYNEFGIVFDEFNSTDYPTLARILFCAYMILVSILLINMLIAMLGKTYQDIASQPNENVRQWARALLFVERMCSDEEKRAMLTRYCHERKYYCSTWALTENDRIEIDKTRKLNSDNAKNALRLSRLN